jgi:hypothetical protein
VADTLEDGGMKRAVSKRVDPGIKDEVMGYGTGGGVSFPDFVSKTKKTKKRKQKTK